MARGSWRAPRLAPAPPLIPARADERALAFGLAHEICGEGGLGWSRRLQLIHADLNNSGGFPERVSKYLAKKYGYEARLRPLEEAMEALTTSASWRVTEPLRRVNMWRRARAGRGERVAGG